MNERIRKLRKAMGLSQEGFAEKVGLTKNYISLVENGNRTLADRTVNDIIRKFNVSEPWLRDGIGEMFVQKSKDEEIAEMLGDIQKVGEDDFKYRLVSALSKLEGHDWDTLEKLVDSIAEKNKKE